MCMGVTWIIFSPRILYGIFPLFLHIKLFSPSNLWFLGEPRETFPRNGQWQSWTRGKWASRGCKIYWAWMEKRIWELEGESLLFTHERDFHSTDSVPLCTSSRPIIQLCSLFFQCSFVQSPPVFLSLSPKKENQKLRTTSREKYEKRWKSTKMTH